VAPELNWPWLIVLACLLGACGRLGFSELPIDAATVAGQGHDAGVPLADAAANGCKHSDVTNYCTRLPELPDSPQIDGMLDCGPTLVELPVNGWTGASALPSDQRARYAVAWRPNGLYVYVEVDDPLRLPAGRGRDPWCGDGVEIYADADGIYASADLGYDDPGAIQLLASAPAAQPSATRALDERYRAPNLMSAGSWNGMHLMVARAAGFALEAFVTASDLDLGEWSLQVGTRIGFDLSINVSTDSTDNRNNCEQRLGQYFLHVVSDACSGEACLPYTNANAFCTTELE
jgi:Carbohydrate family 9 binding domain-like